MQTRSINLIQAKVIDINDPDQKGRIKIRLLPEMKNVSDSLLPWVHPFHGTASNENYMNFSPPELDSWVWCFFLDEQLFKNGFYIVGQSIDGYFNYSTVSSALDSIQQMSSTSYPDVSFTYLDGTIQFHNRETGDYGVYHKSGSYTIFNDSGDIFIQSVGTFNVNGHLEVLP